jgi:hypothetical protein
MTRALLCALGCLLTLATVATSVSAQQTCQQVLPSDTRRIVTQDGQEIVYFRNPVRMVCTDGVQIEADSAVMNRAMNSVELVGRVLYRDGDRQLTSAWAHYLGDRDELLATGAVVLNDLTDGSTIRGDDFEYRRQTEQRPEAYMIMRGDRPSAELRRAGGDGEPGAPVLVWAQELELIGESVFLARREVELERDDFRGSGDNARFDQAAERMTLTGSARVLTDEYQLEGDSIDARLRGDELRDVYSEGRARLEGEELAVYGRYIRIGFVDGEPERIEAWTRSPVVARVAEDDAVEADDDAEPPVVLEPVPLERPDIAVERALAVSRDFRLLADSIDARSFEGRLREVRAIGRAYGEREGEFAAADLPAVADRDWVQGDTITGYFTHQEEEEVAEAVPDEDNEERGPGGAVLERIDVIGGGSHALSLYRTEPAESGDRPALNFTRASRITLFMDDGEVDRVELEGPLEGLYLDPTEPTAEPEPAPARTAARRRG